MKKFFGSALQKRTGLAFCLAAVCLFPHLARAQTVAACPVPVGSGCGATVPVNSLAVVFTGQSTALYQRIINVGSTAAGTAWCSRYGTPAVNGGGSFPIAPFGNALSIPSVEEYVGTGGAAPPAKPISCISDGGTSGSAAAVLTVETR